MDWLDHPAVQGTQTLKSLLPHHSSKAPILRHSAFFIVQISHPYMDTGKTIALIRQGFADQIMSWLFNMLSRMVITFLPRNSRIQFSRSVVFDYLWPHGLQYARTPCPSTIARVYLNLCPLSRWCHATILILCRPLLLLPSIFPSFRVFSLSALCIRWWKYVVSAPTSVLPMNTQDWSPLGCTSWISLKLQGILKSLLQHHRSKASTLWHSIFLTVQLSHLYMTTGKTIALTRWTFVG